ncbi:amidohydrolase family-domain-containing protein [Kockovaella imperatae]|uniref:Amidohydrolase family-domain-containing protein n=1 Tax=Kockovaella imperatae TaxID=4999 RepID=A0A1Y1U7P5_9TREE|nr:amidohydrolase family-domain-containing protein [Kockovaella imperatae]ORX33527.1 amidohydrolase family-domain-containing protein [Kockovaella imperatae]
MAPKGEKDPLLDAIKPATPRQARPPRHIRHRQAGRSLHLSLTLGILALVVLYARQNRSSLNTYNYGGKKLPMKYAVCSREGKKIYTVPEESGVGPVECVVVQGKYVVDTGSMAHVRRKWTEPQSQATWQWTSKMKVFYLPEGHTMTPGLIDSHGHPLQYGLSRQLQLTGSTSIPEIVERVEDYVRSSNLPPGTWIEGLGWDQNIWPVKEFPTATDLDTPLLKDKPIILSRVDVHAIWVSHAVLAQLGPLPDTVEGGKIVRGASGEPTGVFIDNAMDLVMAKKPPYTEAQLSMSIERMMDDALAKGMTGVHDAMLSQNYVPVFEKWAKEGKLRMRFYSMLRCTDRDAYCGDAIHRIYDAHDGRFTMQSVKLFADGALGSRGAALLEDYSDSPGWKGFLLSPEETWGPLIKAWYDGGWQVNVHTIGDKANHVVVNAIEAALQGKDAARQFRLEHAQIMALDDLNRAAKLGVIASYQPTHATSDMKYAEDRLGPERIKGAYAWKTYLKAGGRIALGSDFPVESIDPLKGFYAAVTRLDEDGTSPHGLNGWYASEKLSREEALRGFTIDGKSMTTRGSTLTSFTGAYASFSNCTGSLVSGKRFDAVIWDDDLLEVDQGEMLEVQVKATFLDGQLAYGSIKG